ncbi:MAG: hypothetical protein ACR2IA_02785 [Pyrinomonadaceae bacterium]
MKIITILQRYFTNRFRKNRIVDFHRPKCPPTKRRSKISTSPAHQLIQSAESSPHRDTFAAQVVLKDVKGGWF